MNKSQLKEKLDSATDDFSVAMQTEFKESSKEAVTHADLDTLSRQTFYALCEFKEAILEYLDSESKF